LAKEYQLSDAELEVIKVLWEKGEAMNTQQVCDALVDCKWKYKTVATLLIRMEEKKAVSCEKQGKVNFYNPLIDKDEYSLVQTKSFISKLYNGSAKDLAVSLFKNEDLSKEDIEDIRKMFNL